MRGDPELNRAFQQFLKLGSSRTFLLKQIWRRFAVGKEQSINAVHQLLLDQFPQFESTVTEQDVIACYKVLLGREPENEKVVKARVAAGLSLEQVLKEFVRLKEFEANWSKQPSQFYLYKSTFDAVGTIKKHAVKHLTPDPCLLTNFLGVRINPDAFESLQGQYGTVEPLPIPQNWHSDIAEWAAVLRSVDLASDKFRVLELGCDWGCWLNNAGAAARNKNLDIELIGVGDCISQAFETLELNHFRQKQYRLFHGVAAAQRGTPLFPKYAGQPWDAEPIFSASDEISNASRQPNAVPLPDITYGVPIDLLHIDIQGAEAEFIASAIKDLNQFVRYIVVGTHSREIERQIIGILFRHKWQLEMERPCIFSLKTTVGGVQGWRNPIRIEKEKSNSGR
jgi:hypothetical protein